MHMMPGFMGGEMCSVAGECFDFGKELIATFPDGGCMVPIMKMCEPNMPEMGFEVSFQKFDAQGNMVCNPIPSHGFVVDGKFSTDICGFENGEFAMAWQGESNGHDCVFMQRFDANGCQIGGEAEVGFSGAGCHGELSITALQDGCCVVGWENNSHDICVQKIDTMCQKVGDMLAFDNHSGDGMPVISPLENCGFSIACEGVSFFGDNSSHIDVFDQNMQHVGSGSCDIEQFMPKMCGLSDGGFVSSWVSHVDDEHCIVMQKFDECADKIGDEQVLPIGDCDVFTNFDYDICGLANGCFSISFNGKDGDAGNMFCHTFDSGCNPIGDGVSMEVGINCMLPNVCSMGEEGFMTTWLSICDDQNGIDVIGQKFDNSGCQIDDMFKICDMTSDQGVVGHLFNAFENCDIDANVNIGNSDCFDFEHGLPFVGGDSFTHDSDTSHQVALHDLVVDSGENDIPMNIPEVNEIQNTSDTSTQVQKPTSVVKEENTSLELDMVDNSQFLDIHDHQIQTEDIV